MDFYTGYWGKFRERVERHDEIIVDAVTFAAMVAPAFTLTFQDYRVPNGFNLWVRSVTICSPWASFTAGSMQGRLVSAANAQRGWVEYGGPPALVAPPSGDVLANIEAPDTLTEINVEIKGGGRVVVVACGVPFAEYSGSGGGVSAHVNADLVEAV